MLSATSVVGVFVGVHALPGDDAYAAHIAAFRAGENLTCTGETCAKPTKKFEHILKVQPGYQWNDAGGYCGSWSIGRAALAKGAWISQQQVRDHTVPGGGHDNEILETNIDLALKNLKLKAESFDYKNLPTPQLDEGRRWMKRQLVNGHPLVQMIMLPSGHFPVYPGLPYGDYSHIEPIIGIMSDQPLTDTDFYDNDYIVHFNDAGDTPLYRNMSSLPGKFYFGNAQCPGGGTWPDSEMCLHPEYIFSWAVLGFLDAQDGVSISLAVDPWKFEPDTRGGEAPEQLTGTITMEDLQVGQNYSLYRWDSVSTAFDYENPVGVHRFKATETHMVYRDPTTFSSGGATYYRCIADSSVLV